MQSASVPNRPAPASTASSRAATTSSEIVARRVDRDVAEPASYQLGVDQHVVGVDRRDDVVRAVRRVDRLETDVRARREEGAERVRRLGARHSSATRRVDPEQPDSDRVAGLLHVDGLAVDHVDDRRGAGVLRGSAGGHGARDEETEQGGGERTPEAAVRGHARTSAARSVASTDGPVFPPSAGSVVKAEVRYLGSLPTPPLPQPRGRDRAMVLLHVRTHWCDDPPAGSPILQPPPTWAGGYPGAVPLQPFELDPITGLTRPPGVAAPAGRTGEARRGPAGVVPGGAPWRSGDERLGGRPDVGGQPTPTVGRRCRPAGRHARRGVLGGRHRLPGGPRAPLPGGHPGTGFTFTVVAPNGAVLATVPSVGGWTGWVAVPAAIADGRGIWSVRIDRAAGATVGAPSLLPPAAGPANAVAESYVSPFGNPYEGILGVEVDGQELTAPVTVVPTGSVAAGACDPNGKRPVTMTVTFTPPVPTGWSYTVSWASGIAPPPPRRPSAPSAPPRCPASRRRSPTSPGRTTRPPRWCSRRPAGRRPSRRSRWRRHRAPASSSTPATDPSARTSRCRRAARTSASRPGPAPTSPATDAACPPPIAALTRRTCVTATYRGGSQRSIADRRARGGRVGDDPQQQVAGRRRGSPAQLGHATDAAGAARDRLAARAPQPVVLAQRGRAGRRGRRAPPASRRPRAPDRRPGRRPASSRAPRRRAARPCPARTTAAGGRGRGCRAAGPCRSPATRAGIGACQWPNRRTTSACSSANRVPAGRLATANQYTRPSRSGTYPNRSPRPHVSPAPPAMSTGAVGDTPPRAVPGVAELRAAGERAADRAAQPVGADHEVRRRPRPRRVDDRPAGVLDARHLDARAHDTVGQRVEQDALQVVAVHHGEVVGRARRHAGPATVRTAGADPVCTDGVVRGRERAHLVGEPEHRQRGEPVAEQGDAGADRGQRRRCARGP